MISYGLANFLQNLIPDFLIVTNRFFEEEENPSLWILIKYMIILAFNDILLTISRKLLIPLEAPLILGIFVHLFFWAHKPFMIFVQKFSHLLQKEHWLKKIFFLFTIFQTIIYLFCLRVYLRLLSSPKPIDLSAFFFEFFKIACSISLWWIYYEEIEKRNGSSLAQSLFEMIFLVVIIYSITLHKWLMMIIKLCYTN